MKQVIRIRPKTSKNIVLPGCYRHRDLKRNVYLTSAGDVIKDRDLLVTERYDDVSFTKQKTEHVIEWDADDNSAEGRSYAGKMQNIKWFYENHPMIEVVGGNNKYLQQDLFILENVNDIQQANRDEIKEKIRICNLIQSYDYDTQKDLCYAFGGNPASMTQDELFIDLLDFETGRALINWDTFEQYWNPSLNRDIEYVVIAKKAIAFDIIQTRNNNYVIGQEVIGANSNFDSVIAYLKASPNRFDFVKNEVYRKDAPKIKKDSSGPNENGKGKISEALEAIRNEAKSLGIKGWQMKGEKQLNVEIANAKMALAKKGETIIVTGEK